MTTQPRPGLLPPLDREAEALGRQPAGTTWLDRLIQVALVLYLTPALLIVLIVGGIGIFVLSLVRLLTVAWRGPNGWPRVPVGPASHSL